MKHVIRKQVIDIQLDRRLDGFQIQNTVSEFYRRDILPALEKIFDEISSDVETISIDKLEIDLGSFINSEIEKNSWKEIYLRGLADQIRLFHRTNPEGEPRSLNTYRQWVYYMQYGILPWNSAGMDQQWLELVLEALAVNYEYAAELRLMIQANPVLLSRIIAQHSGEFIHKLVIILTARPQENLVRAVNELQTVFEVLRPKGKKRSEPLAGVNEIWGTVLFVAAGKKNPATIEIVKAVIRLHRSSFKKSRISIETLLGKNSLIGPLVREVMRRPETRENHRSKIENKSHDQQERVIQVENTDKITAELEEEGLFIKYAGIVLLHPFLPQFFQELKLVNQSVFRDDQSRQKGLYLLHYLATGQTTAEEYELAMPKILTNWPLTNSPVEKKIRLLKREMNKAVELLNVAIIQWEVLKRTTPDGLREGFLQRNGKLYRRNEKLYLQMEASSIDVLLDRLPWNLSLIKLPWMEHILRVEWR